MAAVATSVRHSHDIWPVLQGLGKAADVTDHVDMTFHGQRQNGLSGTQFGQLAPFLNREVDSGRDVEEKKKVPKEEAKRGGGKKQRGLL